MSDTTDDAATNEADDTDTTTDTEQETQEVTEQAPDWRKEFDPDKAADRIRKLQSEAKNLRERTKAAEEKIGDVDALTKAKSDLAAENLRLTVGYELGLPMALAKRLTGATREELIADADELVKIAGAGRGPAQRKPVEDLRGGGDPEKEPEETDLDKIAARMFRR